MGWESQIIEYETCHKRDDFANFQVPISLVSLVRQVGSTYKEESQVDANNQQVAPLQKDVRERIGVFKRFTSKELKRQL